MLILFKFDVNITYVIFDVNIFIFIKEIYLLCLKTYFNVVIDLLFSKYQYNKYYQSQNNAGKHALVQLSFSTKY